MRRENTNQLDREKISMGHTHVERYIFWFLLLLPIFYSQSLYAKEYCVSTSVELKDALMESESNGEEDVVKLVAGTYGGSFSFISSDGMGLVLRGGYADSICSNHSAEDKYSVLSASPFNEFIYGEKNLSVLTIYTESSVNIENISIQSGVSDYYGGGLNVSGAGRLTISNGFFKANVGGCAGGDKSVVSFQGVISLIDTEFYYDREYFEEIGEALGFYSSESYDGSKTFSDHICIGSFKEFSIFYNEQYFSLNSDSRILASETAEKNTIKVVFSENNNFLSYNNLGYITYNGNVAGETTLNGVEALLNIESFVPSKDLSDFVLNFFSNDNDRLIEESGFIVLKILGVFKNSIYTMFDGNVGLTSIMTKLEYSEQVDKFESIISDAIMYYVVDLYRDDPYKDRDDDGVIDLYDAFILNSLYSADDDLDFIPDGWELSYFTDIGVIGAEPGEIIEYPEFQAFPKFSMVKNPSHESYTDFDGDGINDIYELVFGTDPTVINETQKPSADFSASVSSVDGVYSISVDALNSTGDSFMVESMDSNELFSFDKASVFTYTHPGVYPITVNVFSFDSQQDSMTQYYSVGRNIELSEGWNMIGKLPIHAYKDIKIFMSGLGDKSSIWSYSLGKWYQCSNERLIICSDDSINLGTGHWLFVGGENIDIYSVNLDGEYRMDEISLSSGWNLIGGKDVTDTTALQSFMTEQNADSVWHWDGNWKSYIKGAPEFLNSLQKMSPEKGHFVHVSSQ